MARSRARFPYLLTLGLGFTLLGVHSAHPGNLRQDPNRNLTPRPAEMQGAAGSASSVPAERSVRAQLPALAGVDIRIDLSTQSGTTAGNWNNISTLTGLTSNLIDYNTGAGTGVSIDGTGSPWNDFFGDENGDFPNQDWLIQPATVDAAGLQAGRTGSFAIAGLSGSSYRIEVVSARPLYGYLNTITVNGVTATRTYLGTAVVTPWNATTDGLTPGNWLIWDNVAPVGGVITITDVADQSTLGIVNAIRVFNGNGAAQEIPTASGWGLVVFVLLIGSAALLLLRRRLI